MKTDSPPKDYLGAVTQSSNSARSSGDRRSPAERYLNRVARLASCADARHPIVESFQGT